MEGKNIQNFNININTSTVVKIVLVLLAFWFLYFMRDLVIVILASLVIASGLEPFIARLKRYRINRTVAALLIYILLAACFAGTFYLFVPALVLEVSGIISELPSYLETVSVWNPFKDIGISGGGAIGEFQLPSELSLGELATQLNNFFVNTSRGFFEAVSVLFGGVFSLVLIVVLSFYFAVQEDGVARFLLTVTPAKHESYVINLWRRSQSKIGKWLQGQLLLGILIGVLVYLGLTILGVKNALILALLAALFEIIPVFGPILAAVPAVTVGFVHGINFLDPGIGSAIAIVLFYVLIQQFENHLIYPLVVRKVVGIPPIIVILALIVGFQLAGILGVILSVPISAILVEFLEDLHRDKQRQATQTS